MICYRIENKKNIKQVKKKLVLLKVGYIFQNILSNRNYRYMWFCLMLRQLSNFCFWEMETNFYDVVSLSDAFPLTGFLVFFHGYLHNYRNANLFILSNTCNFKCTNHLTITCLCNLSIKIWKIIRWFPYI